MTDPIADMLTRIRNAGLAKHQKLVGTVQEVLVDGVKKPDTDPNRNEIGPAEATGMQWSGRTGTNKIVHFTEEVQGSSGNQMLTGQMLRIMIEEALPHCLLGRRIPSQTSRGSVGKGDRSHVA